MDYNIMASEDGKYIVLKVRGTTNRQCKIKQVIEAHALGRELGIRRYLTDVTESMNVEPVTEDYRFAYNDMQFESQVDRFARVALLVSPDDHSHDFIATVSANSGFDVTLFTDREEAIQHLLKE